MGKIENAVSEAKAGFISRQILPREMLEEVVNKVNSKSQSFHVVFPKERIDLVYRLKTATMVVRNEVIYFYLRIPLINHEHSMTLHPINAATKMKTLAFKQSLMIS